MSSYPFAVPVPNLLTRYMVTMPMGESKAVVMSEVYRTYSTLHHPCQFPVGVHRVFRVSLCRQRNKTVIPGTVVIKQYHPEHLFLSSFGMC
jgi:hypothetical protein